MASEYATKRYRSNLINWGILPFIYGGEAGCLAGQADFQPTRLPVAAGDYIFIPGIREIIKSGGEAAEAYILGGDVQTVALGLPGLTEGERGILLAGCLMNFYSAKRR